MAFGHNKLWQPSAVNSLSVTLKNVVTFGHNKLWQPPPVNSLSVTASKLLIAQGCQIGHFCEQINVTNRSFTEIVVILPKLWKYVAKILIPSVKIS